MKSCAIRSHRFELMREIEAPVSTETPVSTSLKNTSIDEEQLIASVGAMQVGVIATKENAWRS